MVTSTPLEVLRQVWGYTAFREPQEQIIQSVLANQDTLAILPTGGGKSVCYQIPALMREGICLVITPLIALMQDQVAQLKRRGVAATAVHAGMSYSQIDVALDNCLYGQQKFLYLSPERLQTELFQARLQRMKVCLVAIDEAHCISQWGHDFRPPYRLIYTVREVHPEVPFLALTASATPAVREDIIESLHMREPRSFVRSFARENLSLLVRTSENKEKKLLEALQRVPGSAIVYVRSRKATETLARTLSKAGIKTTFYHAGLPHPVRLQRQQEWIENKQRVMVATNAFGMGIDKADVRTVLHMDLPESLEAYYQEAGRAGRDGKRAYAAILFHPTDGEVLLKKTEQAHPPLEVLRSTYQALANYYQLAVGSAAGETFPFDLDAFVARFSLSLWDTFPALKKLEEEGLIQLNEGFHRPSQVRIPIDNKRLYEFQVAHAAFDGLVKAMLRLYGAELFNYYVTVSEPQIARAVRAQAGEVSRLLTALKKQQVIDYLPATDTPTLTFLLPRQDADHLPVSTARLQERRQVHLSQAQAILGYVTQTHRCRMQIIQTYFGEDTFDTCGHCDVCIEKKRTQHLASMKDFEQQILYLLAQQPRTVEELETTVAPNDQALFLETIRELVDQQVIRYDDYWVLHLPAQASRA